MEAAPDASLCCEWPVVIGTDRNGADGATVAHARAAERFAAARRSVRRRSVHPPFPSRPPPPRGGVPAILPCRAARTRRRRDRVRIGGGRGACRSCRLGASRSCGYWSPLALSCPLCLARGASVVPARGAAAARRLRATRREPSA